MASHHFTVTQASISGYRNGQLKCTVPVANFAYDSTPDAPVTLGAAAPSGVPTNHSHVAIQHFATFHEALDAGRVRQLFFGRTHGATVSAADIESLYPIKTTPTATCPPCSAGAYSGGWEKHALANGTAVTVACYIVQGQSYYEVFKTALGNPAVSVLLKGRNPHGVGDRTLAATDTMVRKVPEAVVDQYLPDELAFGFFASGGNTTAQQMVLVRKPDGSAFTSYELFTMTNINVTYSLDFGGTWQSTSNTRPGSFARGPVFDDLQGLGCNYVWTATSNSATGGLPGTSSSSTCSGYASNYYWRVFARRVFGPRCEERLRPTFQQTCRRGCTQGHAAPAFDTVHCNGITYDVACVVVGGASYTEIFRSRQGTTNERDTAFTNANVAGGSIASLGINTDLFRTVNNFDDDTTRKMPEAWIAQMQYNEIVVIAYNPTFRYQTASSFIVLRKPNLEVFTHSDLFSLCEPPNLMMSYSSFVAWFNQSAVRRVAHCGYGPFIDMSPQDASWFYTGHNSNRGNLDNTGTTSFKFRFVGRRIPADEPSDAVSSFTAASNLQLLSANRSSIAYDSRYHANADGSTSIARFSVSAGSSTPACALGVVQGVCISSHARPCLRPTDISGHLGRAYTVCSHRARQIPAAASSQMTNVCASSNTQATCPDGYMIYSVSYAAQCAAVGLNCSAADPSAADFYNSTCEWRYLAANSTDGVARCDVDEVAVGYCHADGSAQNACGNNRGSAVRCCLLKFGLAVGQATGRCTPREHYRNASLALDTCPPGTAVTALCANCTARGSGFAPDSRTNVFVCSPGFHTQLSESVFIGNEHGIADARCPSGHVMASWSVYPATNGRLGARFLCRKLKFASIAESACTTVYSDTRPMCPVGYVATGVVSGIDHCAFNATVLAGVSGYNGNVDGFGLDGYTTVSHEATTMLYVDHRYSVLVGGRDCNIRELNVVTLQLRTLAGRAGSCSITDGIGTDAMFSTFIGSIVGPFYNPSLSPSKDAYFVTDGSTIRTLDTRTAAVQTVCGSATATGYVEGLCSSSARFSSRVFAALAPEASLLVVMDAGNSRLRVVRYLDTLIRESWTTALVAGDGNAAGTPTSGTGSSAVLGNVSGMAVEPAGALAFLVTYTDGILFIVRLADGLTVIKQTTSSLLTANDYDKQVFYQATTGRVAIWSAENSGELVMLDPVTTEYYHVTLTINSTRAFAWHGNWSLFLMTPSSQVQRLTYSQCFVATSGITQKLVAGVGTDTGTYAGNALQVSALTGLMTMDSLGNIYIAKYLGEAIQRISYLDGTISVLAGLPGTAATSNGVAETLGTTVRLKGLVCLVWDPTSPNYVYTAEKTAHMIRRVNVITTTTKRLLGGPAAFASGIVDGTTLTSVRVNSPEGVAARYNSVYVADTGNFRIRLIEAVPVYEAKTIAGNAASTTVDGIGLVASFTAPRYIAFGADGSYASFWTAYASAKWPSPRWPSRRSWEQAAARTSTPQTILDSLTPRHWYCTVSIADCGSWVTTPAPSAGTMSAQASSARTRAAAWTQRCCASTVSASRRCRSVRFSAAFPATQAGMCTSPARHRISSFVSTLRRSLVCVAAAWRTTPAMRRPKAMAAKAKRWVFTVGKRRTPSRTRR
jgi:hypothetical protein